MANVVVVLLSMVVFLVISLAVIGLPASQNALNSCNCDENGWDLEGMMRVQLASDFLIALAYFSIPLELLYFISCTKAFPFWWVVAQFGAFIVLCGLTHFIAMWTYRPHAFNIMRIQTCLKVLTALVSCATAISLVRMIPVLLNVKIRELLLQNKAEDLNREVTLIRRQEEAGRCVRMLTQEIRRSIDKHTILAIMLEELGKTLQLENGTIWMANSEKTSMELTHELKRRNLQVPVVVPIDDPSVISVESSSEPVVMRADSRLGMESSHEAAVLGSMVAIRIPLLQPSDFKGGTRQRLDTPYGVMVLGFSKPSGREWGPNELEIVEAVADQVAVALFHAAILEESHRIQDQLSEQNKALQLVRKEAETAVVARNDFLVVMNHEMRAPLHSITALASLLQESDLRSPEQQAVVETVAKSSELLCNTINDMLDYSRLEDGSLELELRPFDLLAVFREAANFAIPMARSKGLQLSIELSNEIPPLVIGDEKRLLQVVLNLIGNAIKFTEHGNVVVSVCRGTKERFNGDPNKSTRESFFGDDGFVYLCTEVRGVGMHMAEHGISNIVQKILQAETGTSDCFHNQSGLWRAVCEKIVQLMNGQIRVQNSDPGLGSVAMFMVRLQLPSPSGGGVLQKETMYKDALKGLKVLVADDHLINRTVTKQLLQKLGCQATIVESGRQCLATLAQPGSMYNLLLLDLWMPEIDGYEVAIRIQKNIHPERRPLVVALTADTDKSTQERCMKVGMDGVMLKPVSLAEMSSKLCMILQKARKPQYNVVR